MYESISHYNCRMHISLGICWEWDKNAQVGMKQNFSKHKILKIFYWQQNRNFTISSMRVMPIFVKLSHVIFSFLGSHLHHMEPDNNTQFSKFFLLGFSDDPELQPLIFGLFLSMYFIAVFGNLLIILVTISDSNIHTPTYFFLSNLSFVRHLLHFHHRPKDAAENSDPEQSHNLWRLHHPDVFLHSLCRIRWHSPECDGLWSVCGHLPPPALHGHHEPPALRTAGSDILGADCLVFLATQLNGV